MTDNSTPDVEQRGLPDTGLAVTSEAFFRTVDSAVFLVSVAQADGEYTFRLRRTNPFYRQQTGLSEDDMRGRTPKAVFGTEEGSTVADQYRRCVEQGAEIEYEMVLDLPVGRIRQQTTLTPVTEAGEVTHLVGTAKQVAGPGGDAPAADRAFFDAAIESLLPVLRHRCRGLHRHVRQLRCGRQRGLDLSELTHKRDRPCDEGDNAISCPLSSILETGDAEMVEHVHYDEGNLWWIGESSIDITDRVRYEDRLSTQPDNLEILNQIVHHDIRSDLQLILAHAETLSGDADSAGQEYLDRILESARDAVEITKTARNVTDVLLQSEAARSPGSLRKTLEAEIDEIQSTHEHALVAVDEPIPAVEVLADDMLPSVFRNLLQNAIVHNDADIPEVTVSATATDDRVRVRIADNGPGTPDEHKEQIFEEGEKGLDSKGTGLGLYLVQTPIDCYGGAVRVEDRTDTPSNAQSRTDDPGGSVFVVELPRPE